MPRLHRLVVFAVACAVLGGAVAPRLACAKDMNGKFGIGFAQTLGGVSGAAIRYWATRYVGIEATVGVSLITKSSQRALTEVSAAFGVLYAFAQSRMANLSIGARLDVGISTTPSSSQTSVTVANAFGTTTASATPKINDVTYQINVEIPLVAEFFFSDNFAVNIAMGFLIVIVPETGAVLDTNGLGATSNAKEIGLGIGAGGLFGSAGFTYYF